MSIKMVKNVKQHDEVLLSDVDRTITYSQFYLITSGQLYALIGGVALRVLCTKGEDYYKVISKNGSCYSYSISEMKKYEMCGRPVNVEIIVKD